MKTLYSFRQRNVEEGALQQTHLDANINVQLCCLFQLSGLHNWAKLNLFKTCMNKCVATPRLLINRHKSLYSSVSTPCVSTTKTINNLITERSDGRQYADKFQVINKIFLQARMLKHVQKHWTGSILYSSLVYFKYLSELNCKDLLFFWCTHSPPQPALPTYGSFNSFPACFSVTLWECVWTCCIQLGNILYWTWRQRARESITVVHRSKRLNRAPPVLSWCVRVSVQRQFFRNFKSTIFSGC